MEDKAAGGIGWKIFKIILYTIFWAIIVFSIVIGINLYRTYPIYPAFQKEVSSYAELQQALEKTPEIYLADLSGKECTDVSFVLLLDGRNRFSLPAGYDITGNVSTGSTEISYRVRCEKNNRDFEAAQLPETTYRDVPIAYTIDLHPDSSIPDQKINVGFTLGQYDYAISTSYYRIPFSEDARAALDETIKTMLLEDARQIIDNYLDI